MTPRVISLVDSVDDGISQEDYDDDTRIGKEVEACYTSLFWSKKQEIFYYHETEKGVIMIWLITLLVGALIGWLASLVMRTDEQQGAIANILIGIVGAALGRWLFADVLGIGTAATSGQLTFFGLLWGVVGAVILIGLLRAVGALR
jgi:uncharacterized membrane protein YeaQ/YmgE (transglycosylase-associated protein family)